MLVLPSTASGCAGLQAFQRRCYSGFPLSPPTSRMAVSSPESGGKQSSRHNAYTARHEFVWNRRVTALAWNVPRNVLSLRCLAPALSPTLPPFPVPALVLPTALQPLLTSNGSLRGSGGGSDFCWGRHGYRWVRRGGSRSWGGLGRRRGKLIRRDSFAWGETGEGAWIQAWHLFWSRRRWTDQRFRFLSLLTPP